MRIMQACMFGQGHACRAKCVAVNAAGHFVVLVRICICGLSSQRHIHGDLGCNCFCYELQAELYQVALPFGPLGQYLVLLNRVHSTNISLGQAALTCTVQA